MAEDNHSKPAELVYGDVGGWLSGPCASHPVRADEIRRGDLVEHEGRILLVTEQPVSGWYWEDGERVHGLEIATRALGARWTFYRGYGEIMHRVRPAGGESP